jgi:hypothetical protein
LLNCDTSLMDHVQDLIPYTPMSWIMKMSLPFRQAILFRDSGPSRLHHSHMSPYIRSIILQLSDRMDMIDDLPMEEDSMQWRTLICSCLECYSRSFLIHVACTIHASKFIYFVLTLEWLIPGRCQFAVQVFAVWKKSLSALLSMVVVFWVSNTNATG